MFYYRCVNYFLIRSVIPEKSKSQPVIKNILWSFVQPSGKIRNKTNTLGTFDIITMKK